MRSADLAEGSFFTDADVTGRSLDAVVGPVVLQQLALTGDPVGQVISVNGYPVTVVGVLASRGGSAAGQNQDDVVLMPVSTAQRILGTAYVNAIYFQVDSGRDAAVTVNWLQAIFDHSFGRAQSVSVLSQDQLHGTLQQATGTLTIFLGAIAGVSLLVGGIGIMNIMLVSVIERTREIGIQKSMGAKRRDILEQFLLEASTLAGIGGIIGIGLGALGARGIAQAANIPATVSVQAATAAFLFSAAVGAGFGLWPDMQASRLDPIVALRYS